MTVNEASVASGIPGKWLWRLAKNGKITFTNSSGKVDFATADLASANTVTLLAMRGNGDRGVVG